MKRKIDIESFLQWTYRDELPKQSIGGLTGWEKLVFLGTCVDESRDREYSLPIALGPPHPDALQLDWAVRQLPDVGIDWAQSRRHIMGDLHHWLDVADPRVAHMSTSSIALVMAHAKMGTRPAWDLGPTRVLRVLGKNRKPVVVGITAGRRYAEGAHCQLKLDPEPHDIAAARFEYWVWRQALASLVRESWNYADHILEMPAAAEAPWLVDTEDHGRKGRVLRAADDQPNTRKLPLTPLRSKALPPLGSDNDRAPGRVIMRDGKVLTTTE